MSLVREQAPGREVSDCESLVINWARIWQLTISSQYFWTKGRFLVEPIPGVGNSFTSCLLEVLRL